jgi:hypothetical protein
MPLVHIVGHWLTSYLAQEKTFGSRSFKPRFKFAGSPGHVHAYTCSTYMFKDVRFLPLLIWGSLPLSTETPPALSVTFYRVTCLKAAKYNQVKFICMPPLFYTKTRPFCGFLIQSIKYEKENIKELVFNNYCQNINFTYSFNYSMQFTVQKH